MNYTELHLHDYFSALDGLNTPAEYMARAKELGMDYLSQTNHGTLLGHREFQREAKAAGITPILGVEAYISPTDRFDKRSKAKRQDGTNIYNHIILLAQDESGLSTLRKLNEIAWTEGFYSKPRIDIDALRQHNEGLIVLSGCLNGLISRRIEAEDMDGALDLAQEFKDILGDRFYIEIQGHNPQTLNEGLLVVSEKMGIKPVVTSDCHYARKEDLWIEEAMLILSTKPKFAKDYSFTESMKMEVLERFNYLYPDRTMSFQEIEIYLRGVEDHRAHLALQGIDRTDIYDNTMEIAHRVGTYPYHEGLDLLPRPKSGNADDILEKKAWAGLKRLGWADKPEYVARLKEELEIIKDKDFSAYFLIVANMVDWARSHDIMVGPGRGSSAGSLVCRTLEITQVDPIKYGLLFMRFINPERNDYPDIDTDFEDRRRRDVKDYLRRKFKNVAELLTVNKFQGKSALRAAARAFNVPVGEVNEALKGIDAPSDKPELFFELFEHSEQGKKFIKRHPKVLELSHHLSDRIANIGKHPSAVVLAKEPIVNFSPLETQTDPQDKSGPRVPVVAHDMVEAEAVGYIKLDALGLKTLSVLSDTLKKVKDRHGKDIVLNDLPLDDPQVYKMLSEGYTKGVFQAEGHAFTKWILDSGGVQEFNDLVIGTSIARPGPMETVGKDFKNRKFGREPVSYVHPIMESITKETLGCIVYQEQVMLAMTELAGMPMSKADRVRKIIGKKKDKSEFEPYMVEFVEGASQHVSRRVAEKLWHDFEAHAGYSFNKSHAVVYSILTYWTAWLKRNYPLEFIYAVLKNEKDKDVRTEYLIEAKRLGKRVLLPHVNKSDIFFEVEDDGIRFGLSVIKGLSPASAKKLIDARPFETYEQLQALVETKYSGLTSAHLSALNKVGAAQLPGNPKRGNERDHFYEYLGIPAFNSGDLSPRVKNQFTPLEDYVDDTTTLLLVMVKKVVRKNGWARVDIVDESGTGGVFIDPNIPIEEGQMYAMLVSGNRLIKYATVDDVVNKVKTPFIRHLYVNGYPDMPDEMARVLAFRPRETKKGNRMANMILTDNKKNLRPILVWPSDFHKAFTNCKEGLVVDLKIGQTDDGAEFLEAIY